jgi:hypothetical protein
VTRSPLPRRNRRSERRRQWAPWAPCAGPAAHFRRRAQ